MTTFNKEKARNRLKELRDSKGFSLSKMGVELNMRLGGKMSLDGENGKQTVASLERGSRGITADIAFAYADIFGVSLDYVFGRSDNWEPSYKSVKEITGFSDIAIRWLEIMKGQRLNDCLEKMICSRRLRSAISSIEVLLKLGIDPRNYIIVGQSDFEKLVKGDEAPVHHADKSTVQRLYSDPAKEQLSIMVDEIIGGESNA